MAGKREVPKVGRPRGNPEDVRRNRVVVLLTDAELKQVERLATQQGATLGGWLYGLVGRALRRK